MGRRFLDLTEEERICLINDCFVELAKTHLPYEGEFYLTENRKKPAYLGDIKLDREGNWVCSTWWANLFRKGFVEHWLTKEKDPDLRKKLMEFQTFNNTYEKTFQLQKYSTIYKEHNWVFSYNRSHTQTNLPESVECVKQILIPYAKANNLKNVARKLELKTMFIREGISEYEFFGESFRELEKAQKPYFDFLEHYLGIKEKEEIEWIIQLKNDKTNIQTIKEKLEKKNDINCFQKDGVWCIGMEDDDLPF